MSHATRPTDQELIARASSGDERAFREIIDRYEGKVAATVVGMLGPGPDAEDVGQETFIRFFGAMDRFRGESALTTYLTRIAINQSLKALKKRHRWHERFFSRDDESVRFNEPGESGDETVETAERERIVHDALRRLNPDHRAVAVLRFMEGYSTRETAEILGIPEGTVMSRLYRATDKLGEILRPVLGQPSNSNEAAS